MFYQSLFVYPVFDPVNSLFKSFQRIFRKDVDPFLGEYVSVVNLFVNYVDSYAGVVRLRLPRVTYPVGAGE